MDLHRERLTGYPTTAARSRPQHHQILKGDLAFHAGSFRSAVGPPEELGSMPIFEFRYGHLMHSSTHSRTVISAQLQFSAIRAIRSDETADMESAGEAERCGEHASPEEAAIDSLEFA